jgi:signal transduction histidine kinase
LEDLSLHILDIAENAIRANAKKIQISIFEDMKKNLLNIQIKDDGRGMDKETLKRALSPFFTTKQNRKIGLGLSMLFQAAKEAGGDVKLNSKAGKGTTVLANFQYNHPDRKSLGNINETLTTLIAGHPEIHFIYEHKKNGQTIYKLDTLAKGKG